MDLYGEYTILIDKRWSLQDLYEFPRALEQVYFAYEALIPAVDEQTDARIHRAFTAFPWRGGYSAVNFYNQLKMATPVNKRPTIQKIQYNSPGQIDLILNLPLVVQIAGVITSVAGAIATCNKVYSTIYKDALHRKLLSIDIKSKEIDLANKELDFIIEANEKMAKLLQLQSAAEIEQRVEHPIIAMKILFSIYRRVRTLAEYRNSGKARLPQSTQIDENGDLP